MPYTQCIAIQLCAPQSKPTWLLGSRLVITPFKKLLQSCFGPAHPRWNLDHGQEYAAAKKQRSHAIHEALLNLRHNLPSRPKERRNITKSIASPSTTTCWSYNIYVCVRSLPTKKATANPLACSLFSPWMCVAPQPLCCAFL